MRTSRWLGITIVLAPLACAAGEIPTGMFQGHFVALEKVENAETLLARAADGSILSCGYDSRSYFERAHERIGVSKIQPGDPIEVLADRKPGSRTCYTRIVHVLEIRPVVVQRARPAVQASIPMSGPLVRGDRSVAGIVTRREPGALWIKTREGERVVLLRQDTRYLDTGIRVDAGALPVNTRVYVRAGRTLYGEIEAYQVTWGSILNVP